MDSTVKLYLLLMLYAFITRKYLILAEEKSSINGEYDVVKFKVPHLVWKQALRPTPPILKSPVTIVLPINVQGGYENEVDEYVEDEEEIENVSVDTTLVDTEQVIAPAQEEIATPVQDQVVNTPSPVAVTEAPVLQDEVTEDAQQDVPGQVTRFPCSCLDGQCGCCTGAILERFRMKACGNMTFVPEDFIFDVRLSVNNNTVVRRRVSASDPPPICFNPRRAPFVRVCAEISNIRIRNRNAHACLDINADIGGFPVYSASFRCFSLGSSGVKTGQKPKKPITSGPKPVDLFGSGGEEEGGFIQNAAQTVLGGGEGLFGGGSEGGLLGGGGGDGGIFGGDGGGIFGGGGGDDGPFDAIGDALGGFLDGRSINKQ